MIAIVDDEEPVRKALARLLRSAGFDVETFLSGGNFLASLPTRRPDCVVLDLHMPGLDGFEIQAKLAECSPPMPTVIMTGQDSSEARERAMACHPIAFLRKPVDERLLFAAIDLALAQAQNPPA